jgi:hypothetical protein
LRDWNRLTGIACWSRIQSFSATPKFDTPSLFDRHLCLNESEILPRSRITAHSAFTLSPTVDVT